VESALGYFINPLVNVLFGVVLLRERLRPLQWAAVGVGALAVAVQAIGLGRLPLRGAFYMCAPYKVQEQQAGIVRAFAFSPRGAAGVGSGPPLAL
jgi:RarD protein